MPPATVPIGLICAGHADAVGSAGRRPAPSPGGYRPV